MMFFQKKNLLVDNFLRDTNPSEIQKIYIRYLNFFSFIGLQYLLPYRYLLVVILNNGTRIKIKLTKKQRFHYKEIILDIKKQVYLQIKK